jgi:hypothetical protein
MYGEAFTESLNSVMFRITFDRKIVTATARYTNTEYSNMQFMHGICDGNAEPALRERKRR